MIYSCFDQKSGQYRYFQDSLQIPVNGDLPVPNYLKNRATKLGVPALEAGRPLPRDAKMVGRGIAARGMIVSCGLPPTGFGDLTSGDAKSALLLAAALGTAGFLWYTDQKLSALAVGGISVAALVL